MSINLNKDKCSAIDAAFAVLKNNDPYNQAAISIIKKTLEDSFSGYIFDVQVTNSSVKDNGELYIMSVYPEMSTIDKIVSSILNNKEDDVIKKIWETNKKWTIEIDDKFIQGSYIDCTDKELTACLLHEIGHVVYSNSLPMRISTVFRYEVTKSSFVNKALIRGDKIFRTILSLPILDACISDNKRDLKSIKEEVKADNFVKKIGYQKELQSVLTKLINCKHMSKTANINDKIANTTNFSMQTIDDFRRRRDLIAKNNLNLLKEACQSPYIEKVIDNFITTVFEDSETSNSIINGRKLEYMHERADKAIEDDCYMEFFIFGGKQLKRIDPNDIDYAEIKIEGIKNESDKMMIVSYINSKIDLVDYYISIMEDPKLSKKYIIPHSLDNLYNLKKRLLTLRESALKFKIPARNKNLLIAWPTGYEG